MQVTDKLGGPFTPPGFYYKTFIRPRKLWPLYEKFLRGAAGLGPLDPNGRAQRARRRRAPPRRRRRDRRRPGGSRGRDRRRAEGGESVVVIDEGHDVGGSLLADRDGIGTARGAPAAAPLEAGVELLAPAIAIGLFEQGLVPGRRTATSLLKYPRPPRRRRERRSSSSRSSSRATTSSA